MNFDSEPLGFSIRNDNCAHCDLCNTLAVDYNKYCTRSVTCANCNTRVSFASLSYLVMPCSINVI